MDNIFCNKDYLVDIHKVTMILDLTLNSRGLKTNHQGTFPRFGFVWYDPRRITNIVSQALVEDMKYDVECDKKQKQFVVSAKKGSIYFCKSPEGLYYMPLEKAKKGVTLVDTVEENKQGYTQWQRARADKAKRLYEMIGFPSIKDFRTIFQMNGIKNCPVTVDDIKMCEKIYGPNIYVLKGKSACTKPKVVVKDYIEIPKEIMMKNKEIELCADIMYIQQVMFLVTVSKHLKFLTIVPINACSKKLLCEAFDDTF